EQKVFGHKFLDVSVEQTLLVRIIIMMGQYHYTHCVPISIMVQQKLTQHMEKSEKKCGFIVARSFQKNQKIKEGGRCNIDRKSTRLNSSHVSISYAVFCL